ncbi:hypothetical protein ACFZAR_05295 [Streptomyces sp. NPDC008222]|uniref:hypothetical protein n=1 Tax=Streptomyces sp. NPDC008222 TaxID=3364820 RepID=UPI0036E06C13
MHVERVKGDYIEPEVVDLEDGSGCLFRFHETDVHEDGPAYLSKLLTDQAQRWSARSDGSLGPVIPVHWERVPEFLGRFAAGVEDGANSITYKVDPNLISQHAADRVGQILTARSPYWQRVPEGYHDEDGVE